MRTYPPFWGSTSRGPAGPIVFGARLLTPRLRCGIIEKVPDDCPLHAGNDRPLPELIMPTTKSVVLLDEQNRNQQVVVSTEDADRIVMSMSEAVKACFAFDKGVNAFNRQFAELLDRLVKWINLHRAAIRNAHVTIRPPNNLLFVVTQQEVEFDQQLTDALTELDIEVAANDDFNLLDFDVLALPKVSKESAKAFLASGQVYEHAE